MYCPLYVKTDYSLLSSLIKIDNLILLLKKYNIPSCAIVDDNLFGTMEIIKKFKKNNIKPVIGLEIKLNNESILLYAKTTIGYHNLIHIETIKNNEELTLDILKKYNKDIIAISLSIDMYQKIKEIYEDLYIGINNKKDEQNALKYTNNTVFVNKTLYLEQYEYKYLPYIFMIRDGKTISDGIEFKYQNNHLFDNNEVINLASSTSINNTIKIAESCNIVFTKEIYMPKYDVPNSKLFLTELSNKGLRKRLNNNVSEVYQKRLNYELDIILKMHFEDYFLVVYDYIKYAKKSGILVGPGRGSAAGSLVSYSLGITEVDPIKYDLLFERFLNPERVTMPDIDTDFPDTDREKVINYVKEKYGEHRVAGIITFGTLGAKQAVRDVGRVLNIPIKDIDYIAKKLQNDESIKDLKHRSKEISNLINNDDKLTILYNIVSLIEKNKRHTSIHAAGIVISYKDLDEIVPIIKNPDGIYLTEYTMEHLEDIGLIKMDFLGIKNLSIIQNIIKEIKHDLNIDIDFNNIPLDDNKVISLFAKGDTSGIFQFESTGMKHFLRELKPRNFQDICAAIALFRPGPAMNIPTYIKRRNNLEPIDCIDKSLENILKPTYGIIVYQEQIMQIASVMAGYTLGEADILRRAMSKKKYEILKDEEEKFINGSIKRGYTYEKAKTVYDLILKFANYGFNKSHSVSYSIVAYKMAYLKYYYPKYFYSNLLMGVIGSDIKTKEYINEIKKLNIKVLPPNVNDSLENKYYVKEEGLVFPLSSIRNVGGVISNFIVEERKNGKYKDIYDFIKRTYKKTNNKKVLESLIYSHALSDFNLNINTLINNIDAILGYVELTIDMEDNIIPKPEIKYYEELDNDIILEKEKELFGFYLTSHKTEKYKLLEHNILDINNIKDNFNKLVTCIVNIDYIKEITTKKNEQMAFITGTDNTGTISITVFPKLYKECSLNKFDIIKVYGNVEKRFDEYQLVAKKIDILKQKKDQ